MKLLEGSRLTQQCAGTSHAWHRMSCYCQQRQPRQEALWQPQTKQAAFKQGRQSSLQAITAEASTLRAEDKWIERTLNTLHPTDVPRQLQSLQAECLQALETQRMPTIRNEEYRYTDVSLLLRSSPQEACGSVDGRQLDEHQLSEAGPRTLVVIVNGRISEELSTIGELPDGVYVGSVAQAPAEVTAHLGSLSRTRGGPFAVLNGALAQDAVCVAVPAGVEVEVPIHILSLTLGSESDGSLSVSSPRLLVTLGENASCQIVEEFAAAGDSHKYFCNAVAEISLEEGASLKHGYVELEGQGAWHMKASLVHQAATSRYNLTETQIGGAFSRHDLSIKQGGKETETVMRAFLLSGPSQLHDLHSKLQLEHPGGVANQLHKCIVSASSGRSVFDGNVKVERYAQQTDAAQLSRNLLLAPKATVNVKPNLQIVADDVKCSHGCAVSDLEEEQLFYFRARGIDDATARQVLVYSFGLEVTQHFKHPLLQKRIQDKVNEILSQASLL